MDLCAQKDHDNLVVSILTVREIRLTAVPKSRLLFLEDLVSIGINDIVVENKQGKDGDQGREKIWRWWPRGSCEGADGQGELQGA
jgi:hypothetical protein